MTTDLAASRSVGGHVSRETSDRLTILLEELARWNPKINLVGRSTLRDGWNRHVQDSIQVFEAWDELGSRWVDLGSGGGFPGLVVAAMAVERTPGLKVTLVESDLRKAAFLMQTARLMGLNVVVNAERIEAIAPLGAQIVSARALAPLDRLLELAQRHMGPSAVGLFPKGATYRQEIDAARQRWLFDCEVIPSLTEPAAAILKITGLAHA